MLEPETRKKQTRGFVCCCCAIGSAPLRSSDTDQVWLTALSTGAIWNRLKECGKCISARQNTVQGNREREKKKKEMPQNPHKKKSHPILDVEREAGTSDYDDQDICEDPQLHKRWRIHKNANSETTAKITQISIHQHIIHQLIILYIRIYFNWQFLCWFVDVLIWEIGENDWEIGEKSRKTWMSKRHEQRHS